MKQDHLCSSFWAWSQPTLRKTERDEHVCQWKTIWCLSSKQISIDCRGTRPWPLSDLFSCLTFRKFIKVILPIALCKTKKHR